MPCGRKEQSQRVLRHRVVRVSWTVAHGDAFRRRPRQVDESGGADPGEDDELECRRRQHHLGRQVPPEQDRLRVSDAAHVRLVAFRTPVVHFEAAKGVEALAGSPRSAPRRGARPRRDRRSSALQRAVRSACLVLHRSWTGRTKAVKVLVQRISNVRPHRIQHDVDTLSSSGIRGLPEEANRRSGLRARRPPQSSGEAYCRRPQIEPRIVPDLEKRQRRSVAATRRPPRRRPTPPLPSGRRRNRCPPRS